MRLEAESRTREADRQDPNENRPYAIPHSTVEEPPTRHRRKALNPDHLSDPGP